MSYAPAWNATFAKPLLNQLIAIIQRDQPAALAIVNSNLSPIREFHKGPGLRTAFPWLTVALDGLTFAPDPLGTRQYQARVLLVLDVGQFDQEMAQDAAQDYARVLDMIVTTATLADFTTPLPVQQETLPGGVTVPPAPGTVKDVFIDSHAYSTVTFEEIGAPVLRVTLRVLFEMEEV
jgi:hypothetical protein